MALIFLLAALVCLTLGLLFASAPWLAASLAASLLAATALLRRYRSGRARPAARPRHPARPGPVATRAATAAATPPERLVWVVDGRARYHRQGCELVTGDLVDGAEPESIPHSQAVEDGFLACSLCEPDADRPDADRPVPDADRPAPDADRPV